MFSGLSLLDLHFSLNFFVLSPKDNIISNFDIVYCDTLGLIFNVTFPSLQSTSPQKNKQNT